MMPRLSEEVALSKHRRAIATSILKSAPGGKGSFNKSLSSEILDFGSVFERKCQPNSSYTHRVVQRDGCAVFKPRRNLDGHRT